MASFAELCRQVSRAPYFVVAYIGRDGDRAKRVRSVVEDLGVLKHFYNVATPAELAELNRASLLHVGKLSGCLLVVWDIGEEPVGQALSLLDQLPATEQVAGFLLTNKEQRLSLNNLLALIGRGFAAMGDLATCLDRMQRWCGGTKTSAGVLDLTVPFRKEPSRWLRGLKHDYITAVRAMRECFEAVGLWQRQLDIDYIGNVLRNLLCATDPQIAVRGLAAEGGEEGPCYREVYSRPVRFVAPSSLVGPLAAEYKEGEDFVLYDEVEAAAELITTAAREGRASILFRAPHLEQQEIEAITGSPCKWPTILVAETALELTWPEWQARLGDNVVGSYAVRELESRRSGQKVIVAQRSCWRACAFLPLPALFDRLIEHLEQTYETVGEDHPSLRQKVFLSLAAIDAARKMYLGEAPVENVL